MGFNVCVVGAGMMGQTHIDMYQRLQQVSKITVVDSNPILSDMILKKFNVEFETDLDETLRSRKPDMVSICTPTYTHYPVLQTVLGYGTRNILIEKPLSLTVEEAYKIGDSVTRSDIVIMLAMVERFNPPYMRIKSSVNRKEIGNVAYLEAVRIFPFPSSSSWYSDESKSGGPILDLGVHDVDLFMWLLDDEISDVIKAEIYEEKSRQRIYYTEYSFRSGARAVQTCGYFQKGNGNVSLYIEGSEGKLKIDSDEINRERYPVAYFNEIEYFVECIGKGEKLRPDYRDGIKVMEIIEKVKQII